MNSRIYKIDAIGNGYLAIMSRPIAGEWIDDEFSSISRSGIQQVVSLLELNEALELGLSDEKNVCKRHNLSLIEFPIQDRGVPKSTQVFSTITKQIFKDIKNGKNTVVHCRAGIGRAALFAAGILVHAAYEPKEAFLLISKARGVEVPDTPEQFNWLETNVERNTANI